MAYTPTVWKDGDIVTSARLNKIENAIEAIAETSGSSSFDFSDRMAKGVDDNGDVIQGAIIEGCIEDTEITDEYETYTINKNKATGMFAHAEGVKTTASGNSSHAEGAGTTASGFDAHAEGDSTTASGYVSHAEGGSTTASGEASHAEGNGTTASGEASHAEGVETIAKGMYSHTEGLQTIANNRSQHVFGEFNVGDTSTTEASKRGTYVEIIGNGSNRNNRSNARTLDWQGNERLAGSLTLGDGTNDVVTISAAQLKNLLTPLIVEMTREDSTSGDSTSEVFRLNKTGGEIYDAFINGQKIIIKRTNLNTTNLETYACFSPISIVNIAESAIIITIQDLDGTITNFGSGKADYPSTNFSL